MDRKKISGLIAILVIGIFIVVFRLPSRDLSSNEYPSTSYVCEDGTIFITRRSGPDELQVIIDGKTAHVVRHSADMPYDDYKDGRNAYNFYPQYDYVVVTDGSGSTFCHQKTEPMESYVNKEFKFSFSLPEGWLLRTTSTDTAEGLLFRSEFIDPSYDKNFILGECVLNEEGGWNNPGRITKESCDPILKELTEEQIKKFDYFGPELLKDIYIKVFRMASSTDLYNWLMSKYHIEHSELERYKPGESIELGGERGYFSATGCCMGINDAYVISKNGYVYEFGTRSSKTLLKLYKDNFKLLE